MKKAIVLISIIFFCQKVFSEKKEYIFYKNDIALLNPLEIQDKNIQKIQELISSKKYKKAKSRLYSLKLEFKDEKNLIFLEKFIDFLEKKENNGRDLIPYLMDEIFSHRQIKAEIFWLLGKEIDSFKIYSTLPEEILNKKEIKRNLDKKIKEYCEKLKDEIEEEILKGNFESLCFQINELPEKIFKEKEYIKSKTLCSILNRDLQQANIYYNKLDNEEKKEYEPFLEILNLNLAEQLKELKNKRFDGKYKVVSKYLYNKIEDQWLLENMPPCYLKAYNSESINLKEMALLFCLYFPQIKGELKEDFKLFENDLDPFEKECLYPLVFGKVVDQKILNEEINKENFIYYLKKFIVFLNLIVPCDSNWDSFVSCGIIPEKTGEKINGKFVSLIIRKLKGDL